MANYGRKYILKHTNKLSEYYEVYFDVLDYTGFPLEIGGTGDTLELRSTQGDENVLEPILGQECLINIHVDVNDSIGITDLVANVDNEIQVTVVKIELSDFSQIILFQGFVVVEDNYQPFHDRPFNLSVRALDGLGLLKGLDLVDTNNLRFAGSLTVIEWIAQILYKTGNLAVIRTMFNFFPLNFVEFDALSSITLNSITFSQGDAFNTTPNDPSVDINALSADDCYTALEKIMRCFRCRIFFENGMWHIVNLYEYMNQDGYRWVDFQMTTPVDGFVPVAVINSGTGTFSLNISKNDIILPVDNNQNLYLKLAKKFIKLTYDYNQSENKICNQDFKEGNPDPAHDEIISSSVIDTTISPVVNLQTRAFDVFCWTHLNSNNTGSPPYNDYFLPYPSTSPTAAAFIRQVLDPLGYELLRFAVVQDAGTTPKKGTYIRSSKFLVDVGDILQVSFEWRQRDSVPSTTFTVGFLYLYGIDGTFWSYRHIGHTPFPAWVQTDSNFYDSPGSPADSALIEGAPLDGGLSWSTVDINQIVPTIQPSLIPVPVSGSVELILYNYAGATTNERWFKNISVTIISKLRGSYAELKGDYNFSGSNNDIKINEQDNVEISDSPKRYFKGALMDTTGVTLIPPDWHRIGRTEHFRFTQAMETIMFNLFRRMQYKMEGTFKGLVYRDNNDFTINKQAGYVNSYFFIDGDFPTKKFILTSFDTNISTGQGRKVFIEVLEDVNDLGWTLPDNYKFDYIF